MNHGCSKFQHMLEAYVDGELCVDAVLDVEQHVSECTSCQEVVRFGRALKLSIRDVVRQAADVSPAFRAQLETVLCAERRRSVGRRESVLSLRTLVPLAAAAGVVLFAMGNTRTPRADHGANATANTNLMTMSARTPDIQPQLNIDEFLDDVVAYHATNKEPEVTEPALVPARFEREIGVPVNVPSLRQYGALWEGGSVVPVRQARAASLRYKLDGHRITVYIYDSARMPLRARLEPRVVHDAPVYVGTRSGYTIAAAEKRGVGYAVATDLDLEESAELVATMH